CRWSRSARLTANATTSRSSSPRPGWGGSATCCHCRTSGPPGSEITTACTGHTVGRCGMLRFMTDAAPSRPAVTYRVDHVVATLTLDRPETRNVLNAESLGQLRDGL